MTLVNCTVDKLLVLALVTNYVTNCSIIVTTQHIPNIPRPKHPTSRTFHILNIPQPHHPTFPTYYISNNVHNSNFINKFPNICEWVFKHSFNNTDGQLSKSNTRSFIEEIVNIFGRDFWKSTIMYNDIEKEILAKGSKGKYR